MGLTFEQRQEIEIKKINHLIARKKIPLNIIIDPNCVENIW